MTPVILTNISDTTQLTPNIHSIGLGPNISFGSEIVASSTAVGNAYFSVSRPDNISTPLRHSHNFNQCIGILGISAKTKHQIAHICPGHWIHDQHSTELLEKYIGLLRQYIETWKNAQIIDGGIQIFGGREGKGYDEGTKILEELLYSIFGYYPQILALPSSKGELQHIRTEQESIIHLRNNEIFTKKSVWKEQQNTSSSSLLERMKKHLG